jgi:hypothetical protein
MSVDSIGRLTIQDIDGDYWQYNGLQFLMPDWNDKSLRMTDEVYGKTILYKKDKILTLQGDDLKEIKRLGESIVTLDQEGQVLHALSNNSYYTIVSDHVSSCDNLLGYNTSEAHFYSSDKDNIISISDKGVILLCNSSDTIQGQGLNINSSTRLDDENYLIATDYGLWIYNGRALKKYYVPGVSLPQNIRSIFKKESSLWILTAFSDLYNYNFDSQILQLVDNAVNDFCLDLWQTVYINKGNYIELNTEFTNSIVPTLSIAELKNGYQTIDKESDNIFSAADNDFYIRLESHYSPSPNGLEYQYSLNENEKWMSLPDSELYLTDLAPGTYDLQFRVSGDGKYFSDVKNISLEIKSYFLNSPWFYLFLVLFLLMLTSIIAMLKGRSERQRLNIEKAAMLSELKRIRSEQKLGQAQLNPHFLFNALNSIAGMIAMNDNKLARKSLNQFAQLMRMALDNSSEESIRIDDEVTFLNKYLSLEQSLRNNSFDYMVKAEGIEASLPPMLIQPIVENAVIHGVSKLSGRRGNIVVNFTEKDQYLIAEVSDNGIGINVTNNSKDNSHTSKATSITENRLRAIDRWGKMNQYIEYKSLSNEAGSNSGTSVILKIAKRRI